MLVLAFATIQACYLGVIHLIIDAVAGKRNATG